MKQLQQLVIAALKHHRHLPEAAVIVIGADLLLADAWTTADVVIETGAVSVKGLGALPQREYPLHQGQGAAQQAHIHVGTIKAVQGLTETPLPGDKNTRIGLTPGNAEIGIFFIILEQYIKMRLVILD